MANGTILELYLPEALPPFGYNDGGVAFGFRVDDIEAASRAVEAAGDCSARSTASRRRATPSAISADRTAGCTG
jgi:hypothetical protein